MSASCSSLDVRSSQGFSVATAIAWLGELVD